MNLIILAAGYATRLYPLTFNRPKPLLPVAGRPMIDHVLEALLPSGPFSRIYVVTNARFAGQFQDWATSKSSTASPHLDITVVNDGSTDDSNKLGAIGDLHLVLERHAVSEDIVVIAGDNLFSERLTTFGNFCRKIQSPVLGIYDVGDLESIKKYSVITLDPQGRITYFEEKPSQPQSTWTGIALYYYPAQTLPLIRRYVAEGHNADQPGRLVQWLYPQLRFFTWKFSGIWYDIGSKETLAEADRVFSARPS